MNWAKSLSSVLHRSFAILILLMVAIMIPSTARAQKKGSGGGGSAPPPHNSAPPPTSNRGGGGGTNAGGHTGGNATGGGSSNTYGNKGGSTGAGTGMAGGSHNSNPYGSYGKSGGSTGTGAGGASGGSKSNPYGEYGSSKGGSNPYGSYGSKSPNGAGGSATGGATGSKGGTSAYGSYGNKGGTNTAGGAGGLNGGTKGGLNGGTRGGSNAGALTGGTKGSASGFTGGTKGGLNGGTRGGSNNSFAGKGGNGAGGFNGKGGNSFAAKGSGPPPGGKSITRSNGDRVDFNKSGARTGLMTKGGAAAKFDSRGHVNSIQSHGMVINHAGRGRTIVSERADHTRLVGMGRGRGYSERGYSRGGHEYRSRTYYYHGRAYARAYRGYYWHGYRYYRYAPAYWYSPGFYGWAYNPWARPVAYGWGWGGAPWYGYYGYYFAPYPVYPSAAFWVTDYLMAQSLQAAYEAGQDSAQLGGGEFVLAADQSVALTPEVKKAISDEVAAIIAAEKNSAAKSNADSGNGDVTPDALDPAHRVFVVATALSEETGDGTSCSLSPGDVITRVDDTPDADKNVKVSVTASQKEDCAKGSQVSVSIDDLQEMHNHLREQVDDGLSALSKNQGKGGLPSGPAGNPQANPDGQAQPDPNVGSDLQQQQQSADQTEKEVQQSSGSDNGGA